MSNKTPTLGQAERILPRMAFLSRIAWHFSVLFVVAFFPCASPSIALLDLSESEAPVEPDESSEEAAIRVQARTQVDRKQLGLPLSVSVHGGLSLLTAGTARARQSGHRLPNSLIAPLRC